MNIGRPLRFEHRTFVTGTCASTARQSNAIPAELRGRLFLFLFMCLFGCLVMDDLLVAVFDWARNLD